MMISAGLPQRHFVRVGRAEFTHVHRANKFVHVRHEPNDISQLSRFLNVVKSILEACTQLFVLHFSYVHVSVNWCSVVQLPSSFNEATFWFKKRTL